MTTTGGNRGLFYYGARYYDPRISVWLSVDPLSREFPHVSPYNFPLNSPINLVDADEYRKGSSGESGNGWTLNNSLRLGAKIKVFGQKVSLGINLGQIGLTFSRLSQGVVIYIYDF
jgi:hypothetical protein